jgi:hypothetical protein
MMWAVAISCDAYPRGQFRFRTPAADPGNGRMRGSWGFTPRIRFMRAQLYAARICEFVEAIFRAPRTLFIHREPGVLQDALGDVAKKFKVLSFGAAHVEQPTEDGGHELGKISQGRGKHTHV